MVMHKDSQVEHDGAANQESTDKDKSKLALKIGGGALVLALAGVGLHSLTQSPQEKIEEAVQQVLSQQPETPTSIFTTTTRVVVGDPQAPPATNFDRPELTVPTTQPEMSEEEQLLVELAPEFSQIVNSAPLSPADVALKVEDFPNPGDAPLEMLNADMYSMSLILTQSYGDENIINALFENTPQNPYPKIDTLIADASNNGRFRFPPDGDPQYAGDKPNFGVMYRALDADKLAVYYRDNGDTVVIQPFTIERIQFNYDDISEGWYLTKEPQTVLTNVSRIYQKRTVYLQDDTGNASPTEVWQIAPPGS